MRALVWIVEDTWEATVDEAAAFLPRDAEITLLYVVDAEVESLAAGAREGLLGRPRHREPAHRPLSTLSDEAARDLLADARTRLARDAAVRSVRGRVEREIVAAAADTDLLVLARDGDRAALGPHSLGPAARFVVDHAPCRVLLVWPDAPPDIATVPPHPKPKPKPAPH
jgi:nucleotide-binding universal stress UspA family protein